MRSIQSELRESLVKGSDLLGELKQRLESMQTDSFVQVPGLASYRIQEENARNRDEKARILSLKAALGLARSWTPVQNSGTRAIFTIFSKPAAPNYRKSTTDRNGDS